MTRYNNKLRPICLGPAIATVALMCLAVMEEVIADEPWAARRYRNGSAYDASFPLAKDEVLTALKAAVASLKADDLTSTQNALDRMTIAAARVNQLGSTLSDYYHEMNRQDPAAAFRQAAAAFREYARTETYREIEQDYLTIAETWDQIAAQIEQARQSQIAETYHYVARTALLLARLEQHSQTLPNLAMFDQCRRHVNELKQYAQAFEEIRVQFRRMHDGLQSPPPVPQPREYRSARHEGYASNRPLLAVINAYGNKGAFKLPESSPCIYGQQIVYYRHGRPVGTAKVDLMCGNIYGVTRVNGDSLLTGDAIYPESLEEPQQVLLARDGR